MRKSTSTSFLNVTQQQVSQSKSPMSVGRRNGSSNRLSTKFFTTDLRN